MVTQGIVRYVTVRFGVFDMDTLRMPSRLIPSLPELPRYPNWKQMDIEPSVIQGNEVHVSVRETPLRAIANVWHPQLINILLLPFKVRLTEDVYETSWLGRPAIMKVSLFGKRMDEFEVESWANGCVTRYQDANPAMKPLIPKFLGHITENGRVIGFLMEKFIGRHATAQDLPHCQELLVRLHNAGLLHRDPCRYNFLLDEADSENARIIDLEHAHEYNDVDSQLELRHMEYMFNHNDSDGRPMHEVIPASAAYGQGI